MNQAPSIKEAQTAKRFALLRDIFSLPTFVFGWSFFWRLMILIDIPYVFVLGVLNMARQRPTDRGILIVIALYLTFFVWMVFAYGHILRRMQVIFSISETFSVPRFIVGIKMLVAVLLCTFLWVIPAFILGFVSGATVGIFLGFLGADSATIAAIGKAAAYAVNAVASIFLFGYLAREVLEAQLRDEGKIFRVPERVLFGSSFSVDSPPALKA